MPLITLQRNPTWMHQDLGRLCHPNSFILSRGGCRIGAIWFWVIPSYISQGFDCCSRFAAYAITQYSSQKHSFYVIRVHVSENRFFSFGSNRTSMAWTLTGYTLYKKKNVRSQTSLSYVTQAGKSASTKPNLAEEDGVSQSLQHQMHYL